MTTDKCFSCKRKEESLLCGICGIGMNGEREYYTRKPITNADHIRTMSDEELADWFSKIQNDIADYYDRGHVFAPELPTLKDSWLDWLNKECEL